jgi:hypothetical protein
MEKVNRLFEQRNLNEFVTPDFLYHGTRSNFSEFKVEFQGPSKGFFFSNSLEHAKSFAGPHGKVMKVKLTFNNPMIGEFDARKAYETGETKPHVVDKAIKNGFDAVILDTTDLGHKITEYIVFNTKNIKIIEIL